MLYISRLVLQNISCVFSNLVLAKDHFLTQYIFARAKQLREGGLYFCF